MTKTKWKTSRLIRENKDKGIARWVRVVNESEAEAELSLAKQMEDNWKSAEQELRDKSNAAHLKKDRLISSLYGDIPPQYQQTAQDQATAIRASVAMLVRAVKRLEKDDAKLHRERDGWNNIANIEAKKARKAEAEVAHLTAVITVAKEAVDDGWNPMWELEAADLRAFAIKPMNPETLGELLQAYEDDEVPDSSPPVRPIYDDPISEGVAVLRPKLPSAPPACEPDVRCPHDGGRCCAPKSCNGDGGRYPHPCPRNPKPKRKRGRS